MPLLLFILLCIATLAHADEIEPSENCLKVSMVLDGNSHIYTADDLNSQTKYAHRDIMRQEKKIDDAQRKIDEDNRRISLARRGLVMQDQCLSKLDKPLE